MSGWTCTRQANRQKCGHHNPPRTRKCQSCGKPRPARRKPAHMAALLLPYEVFLEANRGVERCGICGRPPGTQRLHRDHEHKGAGRPRGLLCPNCNQLLTDRVTVEWLESAIRYLRQTESEP